MNKQRENKNKKRIIDNIMKIIRETLKKEIYCEREEDIKKIELLNKRLEGSLQEDMFNKKICEIKMETILRRCGKVIDRYGEGVITDEVKNHLLQIIEDEVKDYINVFGRLTENFYKKTEK